MDEIEDYHPGRPGCFLRRDVLARLAQPGPDGAELPCQYYPIDPARRGAASDIGRRSRHGLGRLPPRGERSRGVPVQDAASA